MKIIGPYTSNSVYYNGIKNHLNSQQSIEQKKSSQRKIDDAVTMEISKRGFALAQNLQAFDGEEVYKTKCLLTEDLDPYDFIDGSFVNHVAEKYKDIANSLKEKYSGVDYEKQMNILNRAYDEETESMARRYSIQIRILSGDIVLNKKVRNYATWEEAEKAFEKNKPSKNVIDSIEQKTIEDDIRMYLQLAKNSVLKNGFLSISDLQNAPSKGLKYSDLGKIGLLFENKKKNIDTSNMSEFAKRLFYKYKYMNS